MSVDESSEERECPLCLERLDVDDLFFYPCTCKYQVCRFCWHRIRTDENGLCPACRKPYSEDPANFQPITPSEMQQYKTERKQKEKKKNLTESRKHLAAYRVLQRNLVYVVGLSPRIADPEVLKRADYFGKYGKVQKVAVGSLPSNQGNATVHTAYVTFHRVEDALRTIQETNSLVFDGRMIKTSLGTTKYCSSFLRGQQCHKQECMYLHEVASPELSFTKDDMHQGKHTEYERRMLEQFQQDNGTGDIDLENCEPKESSEEPTDDTSSPTPPPASGEEESNGEKSRKSSEKAPHRHTKPSSVVRDEPIIGEAAYDVANIPSSVAHTSVKKRTAKNLFENWFEDDVPTRPPILHPTPVIGRCAPNAKTESSSSLSPNKLLPAIPLDLAASSSLSDATSSYNPLIPSGCTDPFSERSRPRVECWPAFDAHPSLPATTDNPIPPSADHNDFKPCPPPGFTEPVKPLPLQTPTHPPANPAAAPSSDSEFNDINKLICDYWANTTNDVPDFIPAHKNVQSPVSYQLTESNSINEHFGSPNKASKSTYSNTSRALDELTVSMNRVQPICSPREPEVPQQNSFTQRESFRALFPNVNVSFVNERRNVPSFDDDQFNQLQMHNNTSLAPAEDEMRFANEYARTAAAARHPGLPSFAADMPTPHHYPQVPSMHHDPRLSPFNGIPASQHVSEPDGDLINKRFAAAEMQRRFSPELRGMFAPRHPPGLESNARGRVIPDARGMFYNMQAPGMIPPQPQHDRSHYMRGFWPEPKNADMMRDYNNGNMASNYVTSPPPGFDDTH